MPNRGRPKKQSRKQSVSKKDEGFFSNKNLMYGGIFASLLISGIVGYKVFFGNKEEKKEEKQVENNNMIKIPEYPGKISLPGVPDTNTSQYPSDVPRLSINQNSSRIPSVSSTAMVMETPYVDSKKIEKIKQDIIDSKKISKLNTSKPVTVNPEFTTTSIIPGRELKYIDGEDGNGKDEEYGDYPYPSQSLSQ